MLITLTCLNCGKEFAVYPYRSNAQFCCYDCRRAWNTTQGKRPVKQTCQQCGNEFTTHASAERLYCSKVCYWKSKEHKEQRICPVCQKTFEALPSAINQHCSKRCSGIAQQRKDTRVCKYCGNPFTVYPHRADIYCSQSCAAHANNPRKTDYPVQICAKCGREFQHKRIDTAGKYCSRACSDAIDKNPPAQERESRPCVHCGQIFLCRQHSKQSYCSEKCARVHQGQLVRGTNNPRWKGRVEMACKVCGKVCMVKPCIVKRFGACSKRCGSALSTLAQQGRSSSIEKKMETALRYAGLYPIPQYVIGQFIVDFAIPECRLVIECDGDYWHGRPEQQVKDRRKDGYLKHEDWRILRFWEQRINSDIDGCIHDIIASLNNIA